METGASVESDDEEVRFDHGDEGEGEEDEFMKEADDGEAKTY